MITIKVVVKISKWEDNGKTYSVGKIYVGGKLIGSIDSPYVRSVGSNIPFDVVASLNPDTVIQADEIIMLREDYDKN